MHVFSLRQINAYPTLQLDDEPKEHEQTYEVEPSLASAYQDALTQVIEAELAILESVEAEIVTIANSKPDPKDRIARNQRTRAIQLKERIRHLRAELR